MLYVDDTIGNFNMEDVERYLSVVSLQRAELVKSFAFCIDKELSLKAYLLLQKGLKQEHGISEPPLFKYNVIRLTGAGIDDELLPDLLQDISKYNFQPTVNREKGVYCYYLLSDIIMT